MSIILYIISTIGSSIQQSLHEASFFSSEKIIIAQRIAHRISDSIISTINATDEHSQTKNRDWLQCIAKETRLSISQCNRVFNHVYGFSPRFYYSQVLLREAKLLLSNHAYSVEHVSDRLGYGDIAHFSRQFKRWTGVSPSEWRKENRTASTICRVDPQMHL